jgi:formylglycine-generating enzyme required for sulfatase activity
VRTWLLAGILAWPLGGGGPAAEGRRPGEVKRVEHQPSAMVRIPAGTFTMGFDDRESERAELLLACARELGPESGEAYCRSETLWESALDQRAVYLPAYEIDRYEVKTADYRACAAAGGCDMAPLTAGDPAFLDDALPMANVTWRDAADFCRWRGKRLPTEAEWEKAARGVDGRRWPWGNHERGDGANHGRAQEHPVRAPPYAFPSFVGDARDGFAGAAPPGAMAWSDSPYGVYDLAGNVSEWVADYYRETYVGLTTVDPVVDTPPSGTSSPRVYRGGSWAEPELFGRTYMRLFAAPDLRAFDRGFRCARDPE